MIVRHIMPVHNYTETKFLTIIVFNVLRTISLDQIFPFQSHPIVIIRNART